MKNLGGFNMPMELLQPWSTFVLSTKLPPPVLEKMIRLTDEIVENKKSDSDAIRPAQIEDQFYIELKILEREDLAGFFLEVCRNYVIQAYCQAFPFKKEKVVNEEWQTRLDEFWIVSQKDNEYNPLHFHSGHLSAIMYLKIPEYLPSRKSDGRDGQIIFTNNSSTDKIWSESSLTISPQVGDFFIFPASQKHSVYPFRTPDGKGERRSVSFNAIFTSKSEQDFIKKQQEEYEKNNKEEFGG